MKLALKKINPLKKSSCCNDFLTANILERSRETKKFK